jgi:hypothetical protein
MKEGNKVVTFFFFLEDRQGDEGGMMRDDV